jgi:glycosyltransferase involved in cell wall biosynthesis
VILSVTTMLPAVPLAARLERVPVCVYCGELFGRGHRGAALRAFAGRRLLRLTSRLADSIIACSRTVAAQFPHQDKVRTVYPPVDDRYAGGDGRRLRESFGIQPDAPLLASVGYLTEGRGQDVLVRAMPAVLERFGNARCLIAGGPFPRPQDLAYRERLLALVRELGLGDAVVVAGHVENVADVYAAADVVVNPARASESFGRVAFEAGIAGAPAVVSRVGAIPELLRDRESAMIVGPEDPDAIAAAAVELLDDPDLAERLVAGACAVAAERLRPELSLEGFRQAVELALRR